ncbi:MAG: sugar transferase [Candidatus Omnitrophica bacterium]|nr:sugar transferase [Candidatus Omnitrophota bacterium]
MKRIFDLTLAGILLFFLGLPMLFIAWAIKMTSRAPVLYWADRVGLNNKIFKMPKFRTMRLETPAVATHLLVDPDKYLTPAGRFLRKTSLDELPQLFNILKGDMSFVGPRPALFNQDDLIALRTLKGIHRVIPGLTGWAQINGRDDLAIPVKVEFDEYYIRNYSFWLDMNILFITLQKVIRKEGVQH